jgi:hypothetical protein
VARGVADGAGMTRCAGMTRGVGTDPRRGEVTRGGGKHTGGPRRVTRGGGKHTGGPGGGPAARAYLAARSARGGKFAVSRNLPLVARSRCPAAARAGSIAVP